MLNTRLCLTTTLYGTDQKFLLNRQAKISSFVATKLSRKATTFYDCQNWRVICIREIVFSGKDVLIVFLITEKHMHFCQIIYPIQL